MMEKLLAEMARIAAMKAGTLAEARVRAAAEELPRDVSVAREDEKVVVSGKALAKRALTEVGLRGLAALAKAIAK